jgi:hypothetical protein
MDVPLTQNNWGDFLAEAIVSTEIDNIRKYEQTGRPLGDVTFVSHLEDLLGRRLRPRKHGRKQKKSDN